MKERSGVFAAVWNTSISQGTVLIPPDVNQPIEHSVSDSWKELSITQTSPSYYLDKTNYWGVKTFSEISNLVSPSVQWETVNHQ